VATLIRGVGYWDCARSSLIPVVLGGTQVKQVAHTQILTLLRAKPGSDLRETWDSADIYQRRGRSYTDSYRA
jgi:hypothetical protein